MSELEAALEWALTDEYVATMKQTNGVYAAQDRKACFNDPSASPTFVYRNTLAEAVVVLFRARQERSD